MYPRYEKRLRENLRRLIEEDGNKFYQGLQSCTMRQLYRIEKGECSPQLGTLQAIADEINVDMLDFFK